MRVVFGSYLAAVYFVDNRDIRGSEKVSVEFSILKFSRFRRMVSFS